MDAGAQFELAAAERRVRGVRLHHRERETADRDRAVARAAVEARRRHVAVADGLDLLDAVLFGQRVERAHQAVEESDDLLRRQVVRRRREADEIGEHHAQRSMRSAIRSSLDFSRAAIVVRHHGCDQRFGALVLLLQFQLGAVAPA